MMKRPLMTMFMIAVVGMLMITFSGSLFVGKIGGAENVSTLRSDLRQIFGARMAKPEELTVRTVPDENGKAGLIIAFAPIPEVAARKGGMEFQMRRIIDFILNEGYWSKKADFIQFQLTLPNGKIQEHRYDLAGSVSG